MKRTIILLIIVSALITLLIYKFEKSDDLYYVAIGDTVAYGTNPYQNDSFGYPYYIKEQISDKQLLKKYNNDYVYPSLRTTELLQLLKYDHSRKNIKQQIVKADIITLSIGLEDVMYKLSINDELTDEIRKYINEVFLDIEECIKIIRKYNHKDIYVVGLYNPFINKNNYDLIFDEIDNYFRILSQNYNLIYIEVDHILGGDSDYIPNPKDIHLNYKGQKIIADLIIDKIKVLS